MTPKQRNQITQEYPPGDSYAPIVKAHLCSGRIVS